MAQPETSFVREMLEALPPAFWVMFFFFIGSFVGSFLNVVVYRLPRNCLSINKPKRSFCPSCKTQLKAVDNIPIFGYVILRGKCRYCGVKYGALYPLVELLTAVLFAFATWRVMFADGPATTDVRAWLTLLHVLLMIGVLLPWALIDLDLTVIPDSLTFVPLALFIPLSANAATYRMGVPAQFDPLMFSGMPDFLNSMLSALITGLAGMVVLWLAGQMGNVLFRKQAQKVGGNSMGWADVKIMLLLGVMLGWPKMLAGFFVAITLGAIIGGAARMMRGTLGVPFGPFLAIGALFATLFTDILALVVDWYLALLGGVA